MGIIKDIEEIKLIRESALLVSKTLGLIAKEIKEGRTTLELDKIAEDFIRSNNAIPGFLGPVSYTHLPLPTIYSV